MYVDFCQLFVLTWNKGSKVEKQTVGRSSTYVPNCYFDPAASCHTCHSSWRRDIGQSTFFLSSSTRTKYEGTDRDGTRYQSEAVLLLSVRSCHWLRGAKLDTIQESWSAPSNLSPQEGPDVHKDLCTRMSISVWLLFLLIFSWKFQTILI